MALEAATSLPGLAMEATKETALLAAQHSAYAVTASTGAASSSVGYIVSSIASGLLLNKERCKAILLDTTYDTRRQVLSCFKDLVKNSLTEDPNMCKFLKASIEKVIDMVWAEVEEEIERDLEAAVLAQLASEDVQGPKGRRFTNWYWRCRAFVLHHYFPHNKSIFGKLQDPVYVGILSLSLAPICGARFIVFSIFLAMLWTPGPPDEFMLLNFIMLFKGFQFVSVGVMKSVWATLVYFTCYSVAEALNIRSCAQRHGPASASSMSLTADYMGNAILTWAAWFSLRRSAKFGQNRFKVDGGARDPTAVLSPTSPAKSTWTPSISRSSSSGGRRAGGLFHLLMYYDFCCFSASLLFLVVITWSVCFPVGSISELLASPQLQANLFWANVFFSVTTAPFLPLNVPWLFSVFTRSTPTGFNEKGACVAFKIGLLSQQRRAKRQSTWEAMRSIKDLGRRSRRLGTADSTAGTGKAGEPGYTEAAVDFSYGLWRAVLYSEMDGKDDAQVPVDMVSTPDQLMMVWDRF